MAVFEPGILMSAHVIPRPAIEAAILHVGGVVGDEVVAEFIALVDRGPYFARFRIEGQTHRIAQAGSENAQPGTVGIVLKNIGSMEFSLMSVRIIDVRAGTDRNVHLLAVRREGYIARVVSARVACAGKDLSNDSLGCASRF